MSPQPLANKVAVITGGSRGLGRAMAVSLAAKGVQIALVARDVAAMEETARLVAEAGSTAHCFAADVTDESQVAAMAEAILLAFGTVDILVNNAGINIRKNVHEFTLAEWNAVIGTNLSSAFLLCRAFVPHMKGKGYGRIINMTSIMSHVSLGGRPIINKTKAALLGFTKSLALELASEAITVNGISPGPFATEMNVPLMNNPETNAMFMSKIPLGRWGKVEEIGELCAYLCSPDAGFITGTDILIDGGWCAQ